MCPPTEQVRTCVQGASRCCQLEGINMRLHWKKLSLMGVVIAALAACDKSAPISPSELGSSRSSELGSSGDGFAGPLTISALAGNGAPRGKHVFNWNLIGTPHDYAGGC